MSSIRMNRLAFAGLLATSFWLGGTRAWAAQPGEKRINHRGDQTVTRVSSPAVRQLQGGDVVIERVESRFLTREERRESFDQVGTRQVPGQENVYTPVASPKLAPGIPAEGTRTVGRNRSITTLTIRRGSQGGVPGAFVTSRVTREYKTIPDVVVYWRYYFDRWLKNMGYDVGSSLSAGAALNTVQLSHYSGYDTLIAAINRASFADVRADISDSNRDGCSDNMLLIDVDTGDIVGRVPDWPTWYYGTYAYNNGMSSYYDAYYTGRNISAFSGLGRQTFTLNTGATFTADVSAWGFHGSPIILDLSGKGSPDLLAGPVWQFRDGKKMAIAALRDFDLDGTGKARWEWVGPGSGLLVWDPEHSGIITSGRQLFGNWTWGQRWKDGYEPLATLDLDRNGSLEGRERDSIGVWVDADGDGVSDPGEVRTLASAGVEQVRVRAERDRAGNAMATSGFTQRLPDGHVVHRSSWDWISLGLAKAREATYVWVDDDEKNPHGGVLRLQDDAGKITGLSSPAIGTELPQKHLPALLLTGQFGPDRVARWAYGVPGGQAASEVRLMEGGKRLFGITRVTSGDKLFSYTWQAQRVTGEDIGPVHPEQLGRAGS